MPLAYFWAGMPGQRWEVLVAQSASAAALEQRISLKRHRTFATALLAVMAAIYFGSLQIDSTDFWIELVRAGTEAAMVGGLADWFAVTALFRHPLGLPIPHTAVIANNKERIGQGLGAFIERHFLDPQLVAAQLRSAGVSRRLGAWLAVRENADLVSDRLVVVLGFVFRTLNDEKLRRLVQAMLRRRLREAEPAPHLATLVAVLRRNGAHQKLFDLVLEAVDDYIAKNRFAIYMLVEDRSRWWVPRKVDRRIAQAIIDGLAGYVAELRQRDHEARQSFDAAVDQFVEDLQRSPRYQARIDELRDRILDAPEVGAYFETLWQELRTAIERELADPRSYLRQAIGSALRSIGKAIAEDRDVQARMDNRIDDVVQTLVVPWRREIGRFVADVVQSWDTRTVIDRVELAVGKDLQYIRVNGTVVGAIVGCLIYLVSELVRS